MAKLAIKGHKTRGKEVIEILKMLGGKMRYTYNGDAGGCVYIINEEGVIDWRHNHDNYTVYSLEEFLEKFPYKVGDRVKCWINGYCSINTIKDIQWDSIVNEIKYKIQDYWYSTMNLQPHKEETIGESIDKTNKVIFEANAQSCDIMNDIIKEEDTGNGIIYDEIDFDRCPAADKVHLILGDNYEIKEENGNYYVVRKKPQYPKTYEECCEVLGIGSYFEPEIRNATTEECHIFMKLMRLKRCRDAYWKIYGEEKGLGKAWEYDMSKDEFSYAISYQYGRIQKNEIRHKNAILAFPTAEIRDAYKENFDNDIETCKEFL